MKCKKIYRTRSSSYLYAPYPRIVFDRIIIGFIFEDVCIHLSDNKSSTSGQQNTKNSELKKYQTTNDLRKAIEKAKRRNCLHTEYVQVFDINFLLQNSSMK